MYAGGAETDWLVGLNVTRALTCKHNAQLSAGRGARSRATLGFSASTIVFPMERSFPSSQPGQFQKREEDDIECKINTCVNISAHAQPPDGFCLRKRAVEQAAGREQ